MDAVINLAGAPIADRPWTHKRKALLWSSRVSLTETLAGLAGRPAATTGGADLRFGRGLVRRWWRARAERSQSPPVRRIFASQLCIAWEETAQRAEALGIRVVLVRTGLVLAAEGGFLSRLLLPFKLGLGGPIGNGRQWMPWVHIDDQIALIDFLLQHDDASGPYNACAPQPVRNREFAKTPGQRAASPGVHAAAGLCTERRAGRVVRCCCWAVSGPCPVRLLAAGFTFQFTDLRAALDDLSSRL